jgi:hypothetical protein
MRFFPGFFPFSFGELRFIAVPFQKITIEDRDLARALLSESLFRF